jgi:hypothetical protein
MGINLVFMLPLIVRGDRLAGRPCTRSKPGGWADRMVRNVVSLLVERPSDWVARGRCVGTRAGRRPWSRVRAWSNPLEGAATSKYRTSRVGLVLADGGTCIQAFRADPNCPRLTQLRRSFISVTAA